MEQFGFKMRIGESHNSYKFKPQAGPALGIGNVGGCLGCHLVEGAPSDFFLFFFLLNSLTHHSFEVKIKIMSVFGGGEEREALL